ncbi:protein yellow-like [Schistocerca gregaria]|uniref:protein yellow-like n=1 Tax=Schistocerca gregaria TaxID=7010 RepID=UPI00211E8900|nr:protein yellow-like [Schistocerca gregaria]
MARHALHLWLLCLAAVIFGLSDAGKLNETFRWRQLDFDFPSDAERSAAMATKRFRPSDNVPVGVEVWGDRVFVTVPRWKAGVPASLAYVRRDDPADNPKLRPYPEWSWHDLSLLEGANASVEAPVIVSPFRVRADECGRLWVLDTGIADILGGAATRVLRPPALLVFDLNTDTFIRQITFPKEVVKEDSLFANVAVEVAPALSGGYDCEATFAYAADLGAYGLVVHDWARQTTWRVSHNYFHSDPLAGEYSVLGTEFQWTDGLFGLALSAPDLRGHRTLYFHPFSSTNEFSVPTRVLHEPGAAHLHFHDFKLLGSRGPSTQSCASFMDEESGVLFYSLVNKNAVGCWNSKLHPKTYTPETQGMVGQDNVTMVFPNDMKVDANGTLWVLTDRMPLFLYSELDPVEVNFRVLSAPVEAAVAGTACSAAAPPPPSAAPTPAPALWAPLVAVATLLATSAAAAA